MNANPETPSAVTTPRPPQLIQSLAGGFNAVANHIYLIALPVLLDLLLWFGPHIRLKALMEPSFLTAFAFMRANSTSELQTVFINSLEAGWKMFLDQFNFLSVLSTFPIGVPSQMAPSVSVLMALIGGQLPDKLPISTPFGAPQYLELTSVGQMVFGWIGLFGLGLALGSVYFASIAYCCNRQTSTDPLRTFDLAQVNSSKVPSFRPGVIAWQTAQAVLLLILLCAILMVLFIPAFFLTLFLSLVSTALTWIALLLISFGMVWFLVPLMFSPHGIFLCGQSALNSLFTSARLVRYSLPGTGMFLLTSIILYQGLGTLWRTAPDTSWIAIVGIFGNAFVTTGLLAASFVYYRSGLIYMQALRKKVVS